MKAAIVGGGVIGGGWAARFLLHGWDVAISDPSPKVEAQIDAIPTLKRIRPDLASLAAAAKN